MKKVFLAVFLLYLSNFLFAQRSMYIYNIGPQDSSFFGRSIYDTNTNRFITNKDTKGILCYERQNSHYRNELIIDSNSFSVIEDIFKENPLNWKGENDPDNAYSGPGAFAVTFQLKDIVIFQYATTGADESTAYFNKINSLILNKYGSNCVSDEISYVIWWAYGIQKNSYQYPSK